MTEITAAHPSDAGILAGLHARCFVEVWSERAFRQLLEAANVRALLARDAAGEAQGFVLLRVAADECEILSLGVVPELRCRGLGSELVQAGAAEAHDGGGRAMFLEVDANNDAAKHLYCKLGFREVGRRKGYYRICESLADAVVLRRELPFPHGNRQETRLI